MKQKLNFSFSFTIIDNFINPFIDLDKVILNDLFANGHHL